MTTLHLNKQPVLPAINRKTYLKNKETGEVVRVKKVSFTFIEYYNEDVNGEVPFTKLFDVFDVLPGKPEGVYL